MEFLVSYSLRCKTAFESSVASVEGEMKPGFVAVQRGGSRASTESNAVRKYWRVKVHFCARFDEVIHVTGGRKKNYTSFETSGGVIASTV